MICKKQLILIKQIVNCMQDKLLMLLKMRKIQLLKLLGGELRHLLIELLQRWALLVWAMLGVRVFKQEILAMLGVRLHHF